MTPVTLAALAAADPSLRLRGAGDATVRRAVYDVRDVGQGDLFAALDGAPHRGHAMVAEAVRRGAGALLVADDRAAADGVPALVAAEPGRALGRIAATLAGHPSRRLSVAGVTGTDGKTTTVHLLAHLLAASGAVVAVSSTLGTRVGRDGGAPAGRLTTPEAPDLQAHLRAAADAGARWAVVEASSHGLAAGRLEGVRVAVAAVTNVTHEHLDFHGTPAAYRAAKGRLVQAAAAAGGTVVLNLDDPGAAALRPLAADAPVLGVGGGREAQVRIERARPHAGGWRFGLRIAGQGVAAVTLPLPGRFNLANAACAAACATAAGVALPAIAAALATAPAVPGRMQPVDAGQPFAVVVDFAHTPAALEAVLRHLRAHAGRGRLIAVVGSAGERDLVKRPWMGEVAAHHADLAVFTNEDPRSEDPAAIVAQLAAGAASTGARRGADYLCIPDRRDAVRAALAAARPGDRVLLAGKGHERTIEIAGRPLPWDEAAVAREVLCELGHSA